MTIRIERPPGVHRGKTAIGLWGKMRRPVESFFEIREADRRGKRLNEVRNEATFQRRDWAGKNSIAPQGVSQSKIRYAAAKTGLLALSQTSRSCAAMAD